MARKYSSDDMEDLERQYERATNNYHKYGTLAFGKSHNSPEWRAYEVARNSYVLAGETLANAKRSFHRKARSTKSR